MQTVIYAVLAGLCWGVGESFTKSVLHTHKIGPVTARNRFYQVPHCNGMGREHPTSIAVSRGVKAEGGWAVICTEECEIHPTTETNHVEARLWDDRDIPALARSTEMIHEHGSLAGIELCHNSMAVSNYYSREVPMAPSTMPLQGNHPITARAMSLSDIRDLRRWHRDAALRAKKAGFDVIYVYAGHDLALPMHFISRRHNHRSDEYGGSLENRVRLFRELIEDTKEAVGDSCAVAVRFAVDELLGGEGITSEGEGREVVEMLAELPDLWDVNISDWTNDSVTARFGPEEAELAAPSCFSGLGVELTNMVWLGPPKDTLDLPVRFGHPLMIEGFAASGKGRRGILRPRFESRPRPANGA